VRKERAKPLGLTVALCAFLAYFLSNPEPRRYFDYTFRIADAMLDGRLGLTERPPSWLNEMVPVGDRYYSVFPLGSVLSMVPVALLRRAGLVNEFPAGALAGVIAGATALLAFLLSAKYDAPVERRLALVLFLMLGTWMWCNLAFAGAWQLALGLAVLGQLGALYVLLTGRSPLLAGLFFALAFGNRTEVIALAPLFVYLLVHHPAVAPGQRRGTWRPILAFLLFPAALGVLTLVYNYARFSSVFDFGYARIPGVLNEPWYRHGIFSLRAVPLNFEKMLTEPWRAIGEYPYYVPTGFGGSVFLNSPFLLLIFRRGARDSRLKAASWVAIGLLTLVLWVHANPGGWQFSYRYAMILLPWVSLILLENSPGQVSLAERILLVVSVGVNAYATYLFLWTDYVRP
jgi:hypothetical protein